MFPLIEWELMLGFLKRMEGKTLRGQMILEVPVQEEPVPENVLRYAAKEKIKIRDTEGTIYRIKK
ncbi:hypothetical protein [Porphyromonas sp. oral taxon 279]|uniref:hypothetical protein n=1 Tax=Porphyromonas sp. oral taxon 279 TaxID=712438 RepID=UPI0012EB02EA|nr:hypothetical protein [Porphyromonas sp. oral taxon 279]